MKETQIRAKNAQDDVINKESHNTNYNNTLQQKLKEDEEFHRQELEYKTVMHSTQKKFEDNLKNQTQKRNPYTAKMNKTSIDNATKHRTSTNSKSKNEVFMDTNGDNNLLMSDMGNDDRVNDIEDKLATE